MASKEFTIFLWNWLDLAKAERRLKPSYFCVAYALSRFANEEKGRKAWPRTNRLANRSGLSKPTVTKAVDALEMCGLLRIRRGGGSGNSNQYWLVLPSAKNGKKHDVETVKSVFENGKKHEVETVKEFNPNYYNELSKNYTKENYHMRRSSRTARYRKGLSDKQLGSQLAAIENKLKEDQPATNAELRFLQHVADDHTDYGDKFGYWARRLIDEAESMLDDLSL